MAEEIDTVKQKIEKNYWTATENGNIGNNIRFIIKGKQSSQVKSQKSTAKLTQVVSNTINLLITVKNLKMYPINQIITIQQLISDGSLRKQ